MKPWLADLPHLPRGTPDDRPVALLMRHAERPPIAAGEHGTDLALTDHGRRSAEALGAILGPRLQRLSTSPIRRCRETAEALRRGANVDIELVNDHLLGDPGIFVRDPELAWTHWQTMGHRAVLEHLAWSDRPLPGLARPAAAAHQLALHLALALDDAPQGLHLFLTHDAILYPTFSRMLPSARGRHGWPAFLEAAAVWHATDHSIFAYRDDAEPFHR
jgi:broad specificity phosphatase PhoE